MRRSATAAALAAACVMLDAGHPLQAEDSGRILTIDHYLTVTSTVPAIAGQPTQLYMRERVMAGQALRARSFENRVALFVHGAGTPAEVSFDPPYEGASWMAHLAAAGFDVFSVDMTGYGRSTRPPQMNDPCNLPAQKQALFVPALLAKPCPPSYPGNMTTIGSDLDEVGAAVDYIRALRRVEKVSLLGWSLGGPRSGGYAAKHPDRVHRLVWLTPAYNRTSRSDPPAALPGAGPVFDTQSRAEFIANWDRQVGCPVQYDPAVADAVWQANLEADPVGATWGPGVRRAPSTTMWGWNAGVVGKMQTPVLMVAAAHDKQVDPARVKELHADYGGSQKVLIDLGCAGHNVMWETRGPQIFRASVEWLEKGTVNGASSGTVRMGY